VQLNIGTGLFRSTIRFDDDRDVDVEMTAVSLSAAWPITADWTVRAGLGLILDGEFTPDAGTAHDVKPGGLASVGVEYLAHYGDEYIPFVDLSLFISGSLTETVNSVTDRKTSYFATDARLGIRSGWNLKGTVFPYLVARIFGGPVKWEIDGKDVSGSDIHHYQIAIGTAVQISQVSAYIEWAGFGEQALNAGLGIAW